MRDYNNPTTQIFTTRTEECDPHKFKGWNTYRVSVSSFLVHNNKNNAKVKMLPLKKVEWTYRYFKETCSATCIQIMNSLKCTGR